jgi:hypothetical protein
MKHLISVSIKPAAAQFDDWEDWEGCALEVASRGAVVVVEAPSGTLNDCGATDGGPAFLSGEKRSIAPDRAPNSIDINSLRISQKFASGQTSTEASNSIDVRIC